MLSTRAVHIDPDVHYYPTKTPARNAKSRGENAYQGAMTIQNAKGKVNIMRTPFQPKTAQPQRLLKDALGSAKAPVHLITRPPKPLADKTPFANRVLNNYNTPAPNQKPLKLLNTNKPLELHVPTPDSGSARASSTRKHLRAPKSTGNNFQTPANQGNYWDVSEDEIVVPEMEQAEEKDEVIDGDDEIEYMPPNTLNIAYQPPFDFDLPNYKLLGQAALRSVYHYPDIEVPPPTFEFQLSDNDFMKWDSLSLPSLNSDDESSRPSKQTQGISSRTAAKSTTTTTSTPRATSALVSTTSRVTSRPATSASTRRPAISASIKAPTAEPTARPASTAGTRTTNTTPRSIVTPSTTCKPPTSTVSRAPVSISTTPRVTSRPATSASTRRPAISASTKAPTAKPTTRPASTAGTRTTNPTSRSIVTPSTRPLTTTTRPTTAQSTTTTRPTRTISRPATSASTSRPLTSASVRTAASSASTVKPIPVTKSTPGLGVGSVKKSVAPRATAPAATTRNKANTTIKASVPKPTSSRAGGVKVAGNARVGSTKPKADILNVGKGRMMEDEAIKASVKDVKEESALVKEAAEANKELKNDRNEEASPLEAVDMVGVGEELGEETSAVREKQVPQTTTASEEVGGLGAEVVDKETRSQSENVSPEEFTATIEAEVPETSSHEEDKDSIAGSRIVEDETSREMTADME